MFAELIAEEGILKGLILVLEKGEEWTIGRDPDQCTVVIEDPKASRLHARIEKREEGYLIENLSESNPALINNVAIEGQALLKEGDRITLGGSLFRFYPNGAPEDYVFEMEAPQEDSDDDEQVESEEAKEQELPFSTPEEIEQETHDELQEEEPDFEKSPEPSEEDLFDESEVPELKIDLTQTTRFLIKIISGPNTGAEFALDQNRSYLIGTDTSTCDIIFNDLSVSREHARINVTDEQVTIQDLESRNGVVVDKERIARETDLRANAVVVLGTSAFLLIDREAPSETIATPMAETLPEEEVEAVEEEEGVVVEEKRPFQEEVVAVKKVPRKPIPIGTLILSLMIGGFAILLGIGLVSLFQTKDIEKVSKDYISEIEAIVKKYPGVRYTYNPTSGKLFLLGHVTSGVEQNELHYQLRSLGFIQGIEDNVVNDEAVWQEMNILLSKHADFKGVSMHAPEPGVFVVNGYLQTEKQAADLTDYLNLNFNYLALLRNQVVVEESVLEQVHSRLFQLGYAGVTPSLTNGDLQLTGYINTHQTYAFEKTVEELKKIPGIRNVRNYVVGVTPEQGVVDLNQKYINRPLRYRVTGYSKHGDVNINVVINGKILTRGDCFDGYTITGIQPHAVFLEKDGLKYKIEYNKCTSFDGEE